MRLVPETLQEIQDRITRVQLERRPLGQMQRLPPGVAVRAFGDGEHRHARDAAAAERLEGGAELADAAVDDHQIRPLATSPFRILPLQAAKAPPQNLAHHRIVVARGEILAPDRKPPIAGFIQPSGPATINAPSASVPMMWLLS